MGLLIAVPDAGVAGLLAWSFGWPVALSISVGAGLGFLAGAIHAQPLWDAIRTTWAELSAEFRRLPPAEKLEKRNGAEPEKDPVIRRRFNVASHQAFIESLPSSSASLIAISLFILIGGLLTMAFTQYVSSLEYNWFQVALGVSASVFGAVALVSLLSSAFTERIAGGDLDVLSYGVPTGRLELEAVTVGRDTVWSWLNYYGERVVFDPRRPAPQSDDELRRLVRSMTDRQKQALMRVVREHSFYRREESSEFAAKRRAAQEFKWWFFVPTANELVALIARPEGEVRDPRPASLLRGPRLDALRSKGRAGWLLAEALEIVASPLVEELLFCAAPYYFFGLPGLVVARVLFAASHSKAVDRWLTGDDYGFSPDKLRELNYDYLRNFAEDPSESPEAAWQEFEEATGIRITIKAPAPVLRTARQLRLLRALPHLRRGAGIRLVGCLQAYATVTPHPSLPALELKQKAEIADPESGNIKGFQAELRPRDGSWKIDLICHIDFLAFPDRTVERAHARHWYIVGDSDKHVYFMQEGSAAVLEVPQQSWDEFHERADRSAEELYAEFQRLAARDPEAAAQAVAAILWERHGRLQRSVVAGRFIALFPDIPPEAAWRAVANGCGSLSAVTNRAGGAAVIWPALRAEIARRAAHTVDEPDALFFRVPEALSDIPGLSYLIEDAGYDWLRDWLDFDWPNATLKAYLQALAQEKPEGSPLPAEASEPEDLLARITEEFDRAAIELDELPDIPANLTEEAAHAAFKKYFGAFMLIERIRSALRRWSIPLIVAAQPIALAAYFSPIGTAALTRATMNLHIASNLVAAVLRIGKAALFPLKPHRDARPYRASA